MSNKLLLAFLMMNISGFIFGMDVDHLRIFTGMAISKEVTGLNISSSRDDSPVSTAKGINSPEVTLRKQATSLEIPSQLIVLQIHSQNVRNWSRKETAYSNSFHHIILPEEVYYAPPVSKDQIEEFKNVIAKNRYKPNGSCLVQNSY